MTLRGLIGVAALAGATLLLESSLIRLLSVAQFYHFAFLVVSLALLGFGASGSLLSVSGRLRAARPVQVVAVCGVGFAASTFLGYAVVNWLPFDSYSIAWDPRQVLFFLFYYLVLAVPFLFSGMGIGAALTSPGGKSNRIYAANLAGSGFGALFGPIALWAAGVPGAVLASAALGMLAPAAAFPTKWRRVAASMLAGVMVAVIGLLWAANRAGNLPLGMTISPYKGLAHARRYPGAQQVFGRWNAISRVDVIAQAGVRQLPGLSYTYPGIVPPQAGLAVDAQSPQPITFSSPETFKAAGFLPEAVAFKLAPQATVLVLEPAGGLGVLQALAGGASTVTAVLDNPLLSQAVRITAGDLDPFSHPGVVLRTENARAFLERDPNRYDLVLLPLSDGFRPVTSGAYSLSEDYSLTVEAFEAMLSRLQPGGLLVATRWLQTPPSEELRLAATVVEALEGVANRPPRAAIVAYRGVQTLTLLVRPDGWEGGELAVVRAFAADRRYDLVWAPDIHPGETNRFNRLSEALVYSAFKRLLSADDRREFYAAYPFAIAPATDGKPFFFHFFTWGQTPQVLATLGQTWQPFGGSGYFVLLGMLALMTVLSVGLVLGPWVGSRKLRGVRTPRSTGLVIAYFILIGLGFLFVEIPLIQRLILPLGQPAYAFTVVVFSLLSFSSLGSLSARHRLLRRHWALVAVALSGLAMAVLTGRLAANALGLPWGARILLVLIGLAPLGFTLGLPFPLGIYWLEQQAPELVPWAWAINGCASVIASVLAAILALGNGLDAVLFLGAAAYAAAWLAAWRWQSLRSGAGG